MLKLFDNVNKLRVKSEVDRDDSIVVEGSYNNVVMYTFFLRTRAREVLVYQRPESYYDERFRKLYSIGLGGGLEIEDIVRDPTGDIAQFETIIESGLREIEEEVEFDGPGFSIQDVVPVGIIYDDINALVCVIEVDDSFQMRVAEPENNHIGWMSLDDFGSKQNLFEPWSRKIYTDFLRYYNAEVSLESSASDWRAIPGYSQYRASSCGKIKNLKTQRVSAGGNAGRYLKVSVYRDGAKSPHLEYLHILICKAFHGLPKSGQVVLHRNNLRHDCRAANLYWGSQSKNVKDAYDEGLVTNKGAANPSLESSGVDSEGDVDPFTVDFRTAFSAIFDAQVKRFKPIPVESQEDEELTVEEGDDDV